MNTKKIITFLLSMIILISADFYSSSANNLFEFSHSSGYGYDSYSNVNINGIYYNFTIYNNSVENIAEASYATGSGNTLKYPSYVTYNGIKMQVKSISTYNDYNKKVLLNYKNIYLPETVYYADFHFSNLSKTDKIYVGKKTKDITGLSDYPDLEVIIDKENPFIKMKNGAIYSKNGKKLLSLINSRKKYTVAKGTKSFNLAGVKNIEKVILPGSVKKVSHRAFFKCKNLKTIKLSKKTEVISKFAFEKCRSIQKIVLPKNTQKIGYGAFLNCTDLSKIKIESEVSVPKIEKNAFKNTADGIRFIVKNQTVADQLSERLKNSGAKNAKVVVKG